MSEHYTAIIPAPAMQHIHIRTKHPSTEHRRKENLCDMLGSCLTADFSGWKVVFLTLGSSSAPDITVAVLGEYKSKVRCTKCRTPVWNFQIKRDLLTFNPLNQASHFPSTSALLQKIKISNILPQL